MNVNLRNPQQLDNVNIDERQSVPLIKPPPQNIPKPHNKHKRKVGTRQVQSRLNTFIEETPKSEVPEIESLIKISKFFLMKFGLRKRLQTDKITYEISVSDLHIIIHNKVLIQIYNPKDFNSKEFCVVLENHRIKGWYEPIYCES